jgi:hypothetical protein
LKFLSGGPPEEPTFSDVWTTAKREQPRSFIVSSPFELNSNVTNGADDILRTLPFYNNVIGTKRNGAKSKTLKKYPSFKGQYEMRNSEFQSKFFFAKINFISTISIQIKVLPLDAAHADLGREFLDNIHFLLSKT